MIKNPKISFLLTSSVFIAVGVLIGVLVLAYSKGALAGTTTATAPATATATTSAPTIACLHSQTMPPCGEGYTVKQNGVILGDKTQSTTICIKCTKQTCDACQAEAKVQAITSNGRTGIVSTWECTCY